MRDADDRFDHELVDPSAGGVLDELAVDLDVVKRQMLEVVEGAEAGAEVVQREPAATIAQPLANAWAWVMFATAAVSVTSKMRREGSIALVVEEVFDRVQELLVPERPAGDVDVPAAAMV